VTSLPRLRPLLIGLLAVLAAACGESPPPDDVTVDWPVEKLYAEARRVMLDGGYREALDYYGKLEARFPYGTYAQQAMIDTAYAYFKNNEPELAIEAADRFIRLYPLHPNVEYAYYLKGLVNFRREVSVLEKALPQPLEARDMGPARRAFDDFALLLRTFPESRYAADARQRMVFLRNQLAEHELLVAQEYLERGAYLAAAARARYVLREYPQTPATPRALEYLVRAYRILGMQELADDSLRVLALNYPDDPAAARAREVPLPQ
jgi:outer membrane protein assembly factor BamD